MGIPVVKPYFPLGSRNYLFSKNTHFSDFLLNDYKVFKNEKIFGVFLFGKPIFVVNDLDLLKNIFVKDFNHFVDRQETNTAESFRVAGEYDKLWGLQLDNASGDHWKNMRSTFTPIFTSGKMKGMLKFIKVVAESLHTEFGKKCDSGEEFELKSVVGKYSLDALAACAFGVDGESFTNEKAPFVENAKAIFQTGVQDALILVKFIPGVAKLTETLNINVFKPKETKFFHDIIMRTISEREKTKERKNDLVDLMVDCIKEENVENEELPEEENLLNHKKKNKKLEKAEVVATALLFLIAGYDTTGMTLAYLCYSLSKNPEIQERLQSEIDSAYSDAGGVLPDFSTIQELPYLDMVIHETLRKFSPVGVNTRSCTEDYRVPDTDITIKKDDFIMFSFTGIHHDPRYWSHPDEFYPEHFSKEEKATRHPYAFLAFGQGPRNCIGMRFALLEAKVAVMEIFRRFTVTPGTKTIEPLVIDKHSQLNWAKGGLWATLKKREVHEE